ncbi:MAG: hypothetical protein KGH72_00130 [Candidatus Micrarchaeota archaeon]|nr:hypothetical protein [Candidatus Micrarchaeota archaeon]
MVDEGSEDLLIFRLRGHVSQATESAINQVAQSKKSKDYVVETTKDELPAVSAPPWININQPKPKPAAQKEVTAQAEQPPAPLAKPAAPISAAPLSESKSVAAAKTATEKQRNVPKNAKCINHPWRAAFAKCEICNLNYCYAEIMLFNGKYYCIKDIDEASIRAPSAKKQSLNRLSLGSSLIFLAIGMVMLYYMYQQMAFLFGSFIQTVSTATAIPAEFMALYNLISSYDIPVLNILIGFLSLAAGLLLFRPGRKVSTFAAIVCGMGLIFISYQYFSSPSFYILNKSNIYLVAMTFLLFINLIVLAVSSASGFSEIKEQEAERRRYIDWPTVDSAY